MALKHITVESFEAFSLCVCTSCTANLKLSDFLLLLEAPVCSSFFLFTDAMHFWLFNVSILSTPYHHQVTVNDSTFILCIFNVQ